MSESASTGPVAVIASHGLQVLSDGRVVWLQDGEMVSVATQSAMVGFLCRSLPGRPPSGSGWLVVSHQARRWSLTRLAGGLACMSKCLQVPGHPFHLGGYCNGPSISGKDQSLSSGWSRTTTLTGLW